MEENSQLMVCHECDTLQNISHIAKGDTAFCMCCGQKLFKNLKSPVEMPLALILACAMLFVVANAFPIMQISIAGIENKTTLIGSAMIFYNQGNASLSLVVWLTSIILPGFCIFSLLYILTSIHLKKHWPWTLTLMVWVSRFLPWGMMDVFLLAILVALVKLASLADVVLGIGFVAFTGLILIYAGAISSIEMHLLWSEIDKNRQTHINGK